MLLQNHHLHFSQKVVTREDEDENNTTTTTLSEQDDITTITPITTTTISENITTIITPTTTDAPISTTITDNSTTISIPEDGSDDTILIASLTAVGAVILILCIALSVFMYIRGKRRKIVGRYNPAYLEDRQAAERQERHKMPYVIPLPPRERLI